jgi:excisionase family DNA binding protein
MEVRYKIDQTAELTGLSPFTIRTYIRTGRLKATKFGNRLWISQEEIDRLLGVHETEQ